MSEIAVINVNEDVVNKDMIEQLAHVLSYSEPENFQNCFNWWVSWFSNKIPGDKHTIVAQEGDNLIGVARFWKTPFCSGKWLIEGLEVIPPKRRKGIGKSIVEEGIRILQDTTKEKIYVHISNKNIPSINLHKAVGFKKIASGVINSYGEFRGHVDEYVLETDI